ncbi:MAG TPA: plasma-membrane proton-efflux P-type ATPase [Candidatus Paceibacterota bacterium]|nr:plasma-membrane proton-efflux P-type ATPase [Candidatus Paceibacterota bacterium]
MTNNITGLTQKGAEKLLSEIGPNALPESHESFIKKMAKWLLSPISLMLLAAAFLSLYDGKVFDFYFIISLIAVNFLVTYIQEHRADEAIKKLNEHLVAKIKVLRDGSWQQIISRLIVPGDIVEIGVGDLVPADGKIIEAVNLSVNEASLTGESLPKEKDAGDVVYSESYISTGISKFEVTATGPRTQFGKTALLVEKTDKRSSLEKDILSISRFLSELSAGAVLLLTAVFFFKHAPITETLTLDLSLVVAGIPISLPAVMTLVIEYGVIGLAGRGAIVRRISALEDFANVNLVLTDKTGTLTKNEIAINDIKAYAPFSREEVLEFAGVASSRDSRGDISAAVAAKANAEGLGGGVTIEQYIPADSQRKRVTATVQKGGVDFIVSLGAAQIIEGLCSLSPSQKTTFENDLGSLSARGYRIVAVAIKKGGSEEKEMPLAGIIVFSDILEPDAKATVDFMKANGIVVKMVTGDNSSISREIARQLEFKGNILSKSDYGKIEWDKTTPAWWDKISGFSEVLPADKYRIAEEAKRYFTVASTGDGVNDLAALQMANVGIAVSRAVDALKANADIVLTSPGISVIKDAILESRKIFARLYSYSLYRISESLRLIVTVAVLGLVVGEYPLTPLQLILLALLNDLPIISLATDKVKVANRPSKVNVRERLAVSSKFGMVGITNSLLLFFIARWLGVPWAMIQTIFFLKLTIAGHMLIYVAHTGERWWNFLPSKEVILATSLTQITATILAVTGFFMGGAISWKWALAVWIWAFFWMQITELVKPAPKKALVAPAAV